jgi:hypothetical protein
MGLMFNMIMSKVHVGTFTMGKSPNDLTPKCQGKPIWSTFQRIFVTYKGLNCLYNPSTRAVPNVKTRLIFSFLQ